MALSLTAVVSMTGCSSAADQIADTETTTVENSKLIMTLSTASSISRADYGTVDGTSSENYISGVRVYFCDTSNKIQYVVTTYDAIANPGTVVVALDHENIPVGTYHVYIGANLPDAAKAQLVKDADILSVVGSLSNISDVTSANKFTMFGQALNSDGTSDIVFTKGSISAASVNLNRVMAKILLTALDADNDGVVNDPLGYANIKVSDISFTVLNTNSQYYFNQHVNGTTVEDPNYKMDDYLSSSVFMNTTLAGATYKKAQTYSDDKLTKNDAEYVGNSIYCLENTTDKSASFDTWSLADQRINAMKVATYVRISLKATPKFVDRNAYSTVTLTDNKYYTYLKASSDAEKALCFSSIANLKAHFGAGVVDSYIQTHDVTVPFTYDVFVNGKTFTADGSSVLRNHYYILKINNINTPFLDKTMEINTKVTDWKIIGTTTQTIDTSGATK